MRFGGGCGGGFGGGGHQGLNEQQAGADDEAAIGDVEDGPFDFVEVEEVADAAEDDAVEEIADGAAEDQSEGEAEPAVAGGGEAGAPDQDGERGERR